MLYRHFDKVKTVNRFYSSLLLLSIYEELKIFSTLSEELVVNSISSTEGIMVNETIFHSDINFC